MFSMKSKLVVLLLIVGLLSACSTPATATQAPSTQAATVSASDTPAAAPTEANTAATTPAAAAATVSFNDDILPIFQNSCINCHGGDKIEKGLSLRTYTDMMAGSENGAMVIPGNAAESKLAELVANHKMPKRGAKLTDAQVQLIVDWINQGAQDN
jgi:mono/diheme cytochrome c family protein